MRKLLIAGLFLSLTLCTSGVAHSAEPTKAEKECAAQADQKGLGAVARNRFIQECLSKQVDSVDTVKIEGSKGEVSDDDKKKLLYCGNVAAGRHLSGESFRRHMHDCLSR